MVLVLPPTFTTRHVHQEGENGLYDPRPLSPTLSPRAPSPFFARLPARPPRSSTDVWLKARTTGRATYLPKNSEKTLRTSFPAQPDVPGPGQYNPLLTKAGDSSTLSQRAGFNLRSKRPASVPDPHWPALPARPATSQHRLRMVGDGTSIYVPEPGLSSPPPRVFRGRETTLAFERGANMANGRMYARGTFWHGIDHELPPSTPSRLRPELTVPCTMFFWFLPPDDERPSTRPRLQGHNFRSR